MPAEPMTLLLRPRNFFTRNPCLDVPPSHCSVPSGVRQGGSLVDKISQLAFGKEKRDMPKVS
jgi:primary-amine oxidase